jgi:hypothetical protein
MPTWIPVLAPIIISLISLGVSVAAFFVNFRSQSERRHGELAKLHSGYLLSLDGLLARTQAIEATYETIRLEQRLLPESAEKYEMIERLSKFLEELRGKTEEFEGLRTRINKLDTRKLNKPFVLMDMQTIDHLINNLGNHTARMEQGAAKELADVRAKIGPRITSIG